MTSSRPPATALIPTNHRTESLQRNFPTLNPNHPQGAVDTVKTFKSRWDSTLQELPASQAKLHWKFHKVYATKGTLNQASMLHLLTKKSVHRSDTERYRLTVEFVHHAANLQQCTTCFQHSPSPSQAPKTSQCSTIYPISKITTNTPRYPSTDGQLIQH